MGSSSKRQTTMAKIARERALQDKRERKQQKKEARKRAAAEAAETGVTGEENEQVEEEGGAEASPPRS
jgi:hypothetical protein